MVMNAREIIAQHAWGGINERHTAADIIIDALAAAGIRLAGPDDRILGPDEVDPVTLERAAEAAYEAITDGEHAEEVGAAVRALGRRA